jgi:hypothetical protein
MICDIASQNNSARGAGFNSYLKLKHFKVEISTGKNVSSKINATS